MSELRINNITDRVGSSGPIIAGVSTVTSTSHMVMPSGPTEFRGGRGRGVIGSGQLIPSGGVNTINLITIATTGNAIDFGDMSVGAAYRKGLASSTRGVFSNSQGDLTFDYVTISSQGGANDFGEAFTDHMGGATFNSSTRGFRAGGSDPSLSTPHTSNIMGMIIASTGSFYDAGDLTIVGTYQNGASSPTRGIIAGGAFQPSEYSSDVENAIEFITIATSGNSTNFGSLTVARKYSDSSCSTTRGLIAGGTDGSNRTNVIDFITIASQGDATDFGDLGIVSDTGKQGVVSNSIRGLFAGFYPTASRIEFVTIASAGNAADFGDCTYVATSANGCADSHGGIGE